MLPRHHQLRRLALPLAAACALLASGCAGLRCPRIDPTGERCLVWPKDQAVAPVVPALPAVAVGPGNIVAPPVTTDPVFPQPQLATPPAMAAPGVAAVPISTPASATFAHVAQDKLTLTPERVLAPVGSEVVLKASICTTEGFTLADQKIEWMLGRNGVGEFVELGGKGVFHPPLFPWNKGTKVDNYLANGYTANGPLCINRGTADPADDVNILRGDAWISVTSPNEGSSHITAYAPTVESWDQRKRMATIYWVDVQWTFPPGAVASSGRGETLTTVVNRQTDGTPLEGWIVRYQVVDGGALAGAAGGQDVEVRTGPDGRASVQVSPTASGAASSRIETQLIRPAGFGGGDAPRLVVGNGTTIVNWSGGSDYLPPSSAQPLTPLMSTPVPPPSAPLGSAPTTPLPALPATGQPRLEIDLQGQPAQVGGPAPLRLTIRNVGNAPATQVVLSDEFDPGLYFPAKPTSRKIEKTIGSIAPNSEYTETLPFQVTKGGQQCHNVTVTYAEGQPVSKPSCVTATDPPTPRTARLKVDIVGPLQSVLGETATFRVTVKNEGEVALANVETREEYPTAVLDPRPTDRDVQVISGMITRSVGQLEVGQSKVFETPCLCIRATSRVTPTVRATATTDPPSNPLETWDDHPMEILPQNTPPGAAAPAAPGAPAGPLGIRLSFGDTPTVRVGGRYFCEVTVRNQSPTATDEQVAVRVTFPREATPDVTATQGPQTVQASLANNMVTFTAVATVRPGETLTYRIPINPTQAGVVPVTAQVISRNVPPPGVSDTKNLEIVNRP